jgi:hypothetical protein
MSDSAEATEGDQTMRLFDDDYYAARILDMLRRYCGGADDLDSQGDPLRAELMRFCAEDEYLEITGEFGACITARITPDGLDALEGLDELPCCTPPGRAELLSAPHGDERMDKSVVRRIRRDENGNEVPCLYALFLQGRQISKGHTTQAAVAVEAFERGAVQKGRADFPGDPQSWTALAPGYEIRLVDEP